jgi:hypothetical protein
MPSGQGDNIQVTEGSGKRLAAGATYTENGQTVRDEKVVLGEQYLPTFFTGAAGSSVATLNDHLLQIMAGSALKLYIRRIRVQQTGLASAAGLVQLSLFRLSSAGTGGTAITPAPLDTADGASAATSMVLPSSKGTETTQLIRAINIGLVSAQPIPGGGAGYWEWTQLPNSKGIVIPAGTSNGVALKVTDAEAGATVGVLVEFAEAAF